MRHKPSLYFVLYLIAIVNVLAMISERDYALDNLLNESKSSLLLTVNPLSTWTIDTPDSLAILVANLKNVEERRNVRFHVRLASPAATRETLSDPQVDQETGNASFRGRFTSQGEYRFRVWCDVDRLLPAEGGRVVKRISSDTASFAIKVEKDVIPGAKFTLAVENKDEHWAAGVPYRKILFVNSDPRKVTLGGLPKGFRTAALGRNTMELLWENPPAGKTSVTVRGNAHRGLAPALDADALTFGVDVAPAVWNPEPQSQAFWKLHYTFKSQAGMLAPDAYSIEVRANGKDVVAVFSPRDIPYSIVPQASWSSLTFRAVSVAGNEILKREIPVKPPQPPQIRWTGSSLQGNDFVITFASEDVDGGSVNVNCSVLQPSGLSSAINATSGRSFSFRIRNVTEKRPLAVVVRATASGVGGTSRPLDRTYPILY